ncbi:mercene synthase, partial [Genlisea aurea]
DQNRRSGNFKPTIWNHEYILSLINEEYSEENYIKRASELRQQVEKLVRKEMEEKSVTETLKLVDALHKLCLSYLFENEIKNIMSRAYERNREEEMEGRRDLYSVALEFRLLRQYGYNISQDVFDGFKDEEGEFDRDLSYNNLALLELYEASFTSMPGEETLERARNFAAGRLRREREDESDETVSTLVQRALEMPIHWIPVRCNTAWFIDIYERRTDFTNSEVLDLAKLNFNILQAQHQQELKHISNWWKETRLAEELPFARDRLVECYVWTMRVPFPAGYSHLRTMIAKANQLVTIIDDIFDIYGAVEELRLFNDAIRSWDSEEIEKLPDYMKTCFFELNRFVDETACVVQKEQGINVVQILRKSWGDLCGSYMKEAMWYSTGYTPNLEEYIDNAWISVSGPLVLTHSYVFLAKPISDEAIRRLSENPHDLIMNVGLVMRLANDLGTSPDEMERGDVAKSIQCCARETGSSIEEARERVREAMNEAWKELNAAAMDGRVPFPEVFVRHAVELGRMAMHVYEKGDGFGTGNRDWKRSLTQLFFEPLPL